MGYGKYTKKLGERLTDTLEKRSTGVHVFYDHGDSSKPNVCRSVPYFGEYSRNSTLAHMDIAIVDKEAKKAKVLCEIEERKGHAKKIIGHMVTFLLAERIRICYVDYDLDGTVLLLGLKSTEKAEKIKERIQTIVKPELINRAEKIRIISDSDNEKLINKINEEILNNIGIA